MDDQQRLEYGPPGSYALVGYSLTSEPLMYVNMALRRLVKTLSMYERIRNHSVIELIEVTRTFYFQNFASRRCSGCETFRRLSSAAHPTGLTLKVYKYLHNGVNIDRTATNVLAHVASNQ